MTLYKWQSVPYFTTQYFHLFTSFFQFFVKKLATKKNVNFIGRLLVIGRRIEFNFATLQPCDSQRFVTINFAVQTRSVAFFHSHQPRWRGKKWRSWKIYTIHNSNWEISIPFLLRPFYFASLWIQLGTNFSLKLTIDFELYNFSNSSSDAVARLTQIITFSVFLHMLQ